MSKKIVLLLCFTFLFSMALSAHADPDLLCEYTFDSQNADDSSGNGHHGFVLGNVTFVYEPNRGSGSYVAYFPTGGGGNHIDCGGGGDWAIPDVNAASISAWFRTENGFPEKYAFLGNVDGLWRVTCINENMRLFDLPDGGNLISNNDTCGNDQWHHIAGTYDGSKRILYIDGKLDNSDSYSGPFNQDNTNPFLIGGAYAGTGTSRDWRGYIDDLRFHTRALSHKEVLEYAEVDTAQGHWPDGETGMFSEVELSWIAAYSESRTFNVYYGTDANNVNDSQPGDLIGDTTLVASHTATTLTESFTPDTIYFWRVDVVDGANVYADEGIHTFSIAPANSYDFLPADGMTGLPAQGLLFAWTPGCLPVDGYNVYMGTDQSSLTKQNAALLTDPNFTPAGITDSTTYYWQVEDVSTSSVLSPVMSFTTADPVDPALVGWWKLEDSTMALDYSGNGNHGTFVGNVEIVEDPEKGKVLSCTDAYADCGTSPVFDITDQITMSAWFKVDSYVTSGQTLLSKGEDTYQLRRTGSDNHSAKIGAEGLECDLDCEGAGWVHVAATYDSTSGNFRLYINGELDKFTILSGPITTNDQPLWIGGNSVEGRLWTGLIDDVRLYNRVLSYKEVRGLYWEAFPPDLDYVMIDDMEDYDDTTNPINGSDGWLDGYGPTGFTSLAKATNGDPAFLDQSLKFNYDNTYWVGTGTSYNSECVKTLDSPMDLTEDNLAFLTINFYGSIYNVPEKFYVALEDDAGVDHTVYHPEDDPNFLLTESWQTWEIPLTDFTGVDLTQVRKIYIGSGTRGDDEYANNSDWRYGVIYIDDVTVNYPACRPDIQKPVADFTDDCVVDLMDIQAMANDWLIRDVTIVPVPVDDTNLAGYWNFDDENADDASGNGHHGTELGTVEYVFDAERNSTVLSLTNGDGNWGNCINVGGGDEPTDPNWANGFKQITVAAWATIEQFNAPYQYLVAKEGSWRMMRNSSQDRMRFYTNSVGNSSLVGTEDSDIQGGDWHHVACVYDGDAKYLYIDGALNKTQGTNGNPVSDSTNNVIIGGTERGDSQQRQWNGMIDEVRIYNRALTQEELVYIAYGGNHVIPIDTPADMVTVGVPGEEIVNYKDFSVIADTWLEEILWP